MKKGIDTYIAGKNVAGLLHLSLVYLALLVAVFFLRYFQQVLTQGLGQKIMFDLRRRLFSHVQGLSVSYFERNPVGRIMTRLTGDVEVLNDLFTSGLVSIFGDIVILLGIMTAMLLLDWRLALVCFVVLPPLIWATLIFRARVRESYTTIRVKVAAMNAFLQENLTGMSLVQLFRREEAARETFDGINRDHRDAFLRSVEAYSVYFPVVELLEVGAVALILGYGGDRVFSKALSFGSLIAFIQYSERFFRPIRDLSERYNTLQGAMASSERIFELLDTQTDVPAPATPKLPEVARGEVVFDRVRFGYKEDEPVLHDLSFRIAPGESVALVGHTGAGKTTIASLLVRFYDIWEGSIRVDGVEVGDYPIEALRRRIAIVPQDVVHLLGLGAAEHRAARRRDRLRAGTCGGRRGGRRRFPGAAAAGTRDRSARARQHALGGPEAVDLLRARAGAGPTDPDPRRGHLVGRHPVGVQDPRGPAGADPRTDQPRDRPPPIDDPPRRPDPRPAQGTARR